MIQKTFKRCENKYLLSSKQYKSIMCYLPLYMKSDIYSQENKCYSIYNIYYDTKDSEIIRTSLSKPYYKEKLRLRSYSIPSVPEDMIFLELKKKIGKEVSKRRALMSLFEAETFIETGIPPTSDSYINTLVINEIKEFLTRHSISPAVYIAYNRMAYMGLEDESFRITFDRNILARRENLTLTSTAYGIPLLEDSQYLMEIKISGAIPLWMTHVLAANNIYSTSFSKYGREHKRYCLQKTLQYNTYREELHNA